MPVESTKVIALLKSVYPFYKLGDEAIALIADKVIEANFSDGEIIYHQSDPAEGERLSIVFTGTVIISRFKGSKKINVGTLGPGAMLGYEMLEDYHPFHTTATAMGNVTLLQLDRAGARDILQRVPELRLGLKILLDSYQLRLKTDLNWLASGEAITYIAQRHPIHFGLRLTPVVPVLLISLFLFPSLYSMGTSVTVLLIAMVVELLLILAWGGWQYYDWWNDISVVTNQRVLFSEKILWLYESRQEAPLNAILSLSSTSSQFGRIFSYGNVVVRTQAGSITLPKITHPQQVINLIELEWSKIKIDRTKTERKAFEEIIRSRIKPQPGSPPKPAGAPSTSKISPKKFAFKEWLSESFDMQIIKGTNVTYRMHWLFLLRNIALPSLLLLVLWGGLFARMANVFEVISVGAIFLFTSILSLPAGGWWLYQFLDWRDDYYVITPDQVLDVFKKPLGREEKKSTSLKNIQSVEFERKGLLGLIFNFGTVYIKVGEATLTFNNVFNPAEVQQELFKRLADRDLKERMSQGEAERQKFADWISAYHRVAEEERGSIPPQRR